MDAQSLNRQLSDLYEPAVEHFAHDYSHFTGLSRLLLICVPEAYFRSSVKLMVVGQQTYGWENKNEHTVDALMKEYKDFDLSRERPTSVFWQAAHELHKKLNPDGPEHAFLWSNLVKVDQNRRRPQPEIEAVVSQYELLQKEIKITKPDVVVFLTGPSYDERLYNSFPGAMPEEILPEPKLNRLDYEQLPMNTFRTYHPGYLRRSKQWSILDDIISSIDAN